MNRRGLFLAVGIVAGALAVLLVAIETSFDQPVAAGGAYLLWADLIVENNLRLPETFPFFGSESDAFAYPPLGLYLLALLEKAGLPLVSSLTWLAFVAYALAVGAVGSLYYTMAQRRVLVAAVAAVIFLVEPSSVVFNLDAGGLIRSMGLMWAVLCVLGGSLLFSTATRGRPRGVLIVLTGAAFGLTVLTHLEEAYFAGLSLLFLFAWHDRSVSGFLAGLGVLAVGTLVAGPWLVHLSQIDGLSSIRSAAGTHGGLIHPEGVVSILRPSGSSLLSLTGPLIAIVMLANLLSWRWFFPVWVLLVSVTSRGEHTVLVAAPMLAVFLIEDLPARIDAARMPDRVRRVLAAWTGRLWGGEPLTARAVATVVLVASVLTYQTLVAVLFIVPDPTDGPDEQFRPYISSAVIASMEWAGQQTPDESLHAVYGDAGEWFPYFARRTNLTVARGTEWSGGGTETETYKFRTEVLVPRLAECLTVTCIIETTTELVGRPDYLYLVQQGYVGRTPDGWWSAIQREVDHDFSQSVVFRNDEVVSLDLSSMALRR